MSDDRPSVYTEGDKTIWRASALGGCTSSLAWALLGTEPEPWPDFMLKAFAGGNAMEKTLIDKLSFDWDLGPPETHFETDDSGQELLELAWGKEIIRCHPDGVYGVDGVDHVIEVKFLGDALWNKVRKDIKSMPNYAWQASIEMAATGMPLLYGIGHKDKDGKLVDFYSKVYTEAPYTKGQIKKRVASVRAMVLAGDISNCEYSMFPCPYYPFHRESDPMWEKDEQYFDGDHAAILDDIVADYASAKRAEDAAKIVKKDATKAFNKFIAEHDVKPGARLRTDDSTVTYVKQTRTKTDYKKMLTDHPEIVVGPYESTYVITYPKVTP